MDRSHLPAIVDPDDGAPGERCAGVAEAGRISEESAGAIVEWHGKRSEDIARCEAALRIGVVLGWSEEIRSLNLEALEMERAAYLKRPRMGMRLGTVAD